MTKQGRLLVKLCVGIIGLATMVQAIASQPLAGHVPAAVRGMTALGRLPQTNRLQLSIGLPLRNTNELKNLLEDIYNPGSPNFRHYLTPEEFTQRFGPTEEDYAAVVKFCGTNNVTITSLHSNRTLVGITAPVSEIERVFHTRLNLYRHPRENRLFYAPETEPSISLPTKVLHIQGLNNLNPPRALSKRVPIDQVGQQNVTPNAGGGSGTGGSYMGKDFRLAYAPGVTLTGSNQILGLLEFDGYYPSDITTYLTKAGLSAVPLKNVLLEGFNGVPGADNGEVSMDIQVAIAMAPGLKQILVYEAGQSSTADVLLNRMATDNTAKQISCSWTWGDQSISTDQIFEQLAAQGQSFFQAAGDWNAWTPGTAIDAPADNPYVTVVGGTALTTSFDHSWAGETVWNDGDYGTGGGYSTGFSQPSWQSGINLTGAAGSPTMRNIPDVALVAKNVMSIADNGVTYNTRGTSVSAPLWAAFAAMINQQAAANGQPSIGFINPALYAVGKSSSSNYLRTFHDTITGNNATNFNSDYFYAAGGYDLCTGWGTPTGSNTINALLQVANKQVDHFSWTAAEPISAGTPFNATVNAQAFDNTLVSTFNGTAALYAVQLRTNLLFSRDFESGMISDWYLGYGYTAVFDSKIAAVGNQSLSLTGGANSNYDGIAHSFANLTPGAVEFYIRAPATNLACGYFVAGSDIFRSNSVFHFRMDSTAAMGLTDGQGNFYTTNYAANQWYKIDLLLDWTNKVVGYYVNDALVANNVPFCNPNISGIATVNLFNYDKAQVWYDQITFPQISSATVALSPTGSVTFTNGVWSGPVTISQVNTNVQLAASDSTGHGGFSAPFAVQGPPPQITTHPASLVVNPGEPAFFNVTATGVGPLSYVWQQNGTPVASATNASYTVRAAQWTDSGSLFNCIVRDANGAATSQSAKLTVRPTFGLGTITTNAFKVILNGAPGSNYVIQTSVDLTNWTPLITIPNFSTSNVFIETNLSLPYRFYRISGTP